MLLKHATVGLIKTEAYTDQQNELAALLRVVAHPARIAILQKLALEDCCICRDFTDEIALAQPTMSKHLQELEASGILKSATSGTAKRYCIDPARWRAVSGVVSAFLASIDDATQCC